MTCRGTRASSGSHYDCLLTGFLLVRSSFKTVEIDLASSTAVVGGGAKWGDVDQATIKHGLAVVGGTNDDTGVAGFVHFLLAGSSPSFADVLSFQPHSRRRLWMAVVERWTGLRQRSGVSGRDGRRALGCGHGRHRARPVVRSPRYVNSLYVTRHAQKRHLTGDRPSRGRRQLRRRYALCLPAAPSAARRLLPPVDAWPRLDQAARRHRRDWQQARRLALQHLDGLGSGSGRTGKCIARRKVFWNPLTLRALV